MATGTVKWFNDAKGFGFIEPDGGEGDAFAHFSAIAMEGFKTLRQGARVQFELVRGPKGWLAQNIQCDAPLASAVTGDGSQLPGTARVHAPQFRATGHGEAPPQ